MTDKQIMETLFSGELSIGQMEEVQETRKALKDPEMRRELVRIARKLANGTYYTD